MLPCSVTFFVCFVLDTVVSFNHTSVHVIHEDIIFGCGEILKFIGICEYSFVLRKIVGSIFEKKSQRDSILDITFFYFLML